MRFVLREERGFVEEEGVRRGWEMGVLLGREGGERRWEGDKPAGAEVAFADARRVRGGEDVVRVGGYGGRRFLMDGWRKARREERLRQRTRTVVE